MSQLCKEQRYLIFILKKQNFSNKYIASIINVHPSTIGRELKRNSTRGNYDYEKAEKKTKNRHKKKSKKIRFTKDVECFVISHLQLYHSPEQISGLAARLNLAFVSAETIYKYIWKDKKQGGFLFRYLRSGLKSYHKRGLVKKSKILDRKSIHDRPDIVNQRLRFGDLEVDTVVGKTRCSGLLTINDRLTGYLWCSYVPNFTAVCISETINRLLHPIKNKLFTITSDNGKEFSNHKDVTSFLNIDFYFADPYKSWQRGSNENLNGLIRWFYPKKTDFDSVPASDLQRVVNIINSRPRKRFNYLSPVELFVY